MQITTNGNEVTINGESVMITSKSMTILKLLLKTDGVVEMQALKDATRIVSTHTMRQHVSTLRIGLRIIDGPAIVTHFTVGYEIKESEL